MNKKIAIDAFVASVLWVRCPRERFLTFFIGLQTLGWDFLVFILNYPPFVVSPIILVSELKSW